MQLLNRRPLFTVLVLSIITLFLAAACTGPEGTTGSQGSSGAAGAAGPQGPAGPAGAVGASGSRGGQGATGATGATGDTGPAGPTVPISLVVVPTSATGVSTGGLPAVVIVENDGPKFTIYATGFPAGDLVTVELSVDASTSYIMRRIASGSDYEVRGSGAYMAKFQGPRQLTPNVPAGLYTVTATAGPSGVSATAPLLVVLTK